MASTITTATVSFYTSCLPPQCQDVENPDESDHQTLDAQLGLKVTYVVIGLVGMLGNAVVASVIISSPWLRATTTNILIVNQSAIDFCAAMFIVLTSMLRDVNEAGGDTAKELFCRLWANNLPIWALFMSSTYNLMAISLERYTAIVHPLKYVGQEPGMRIYVIMTLTWLSGIAYNVAYMVPTSAYTGDGCTAYTEWPSLRCKQVIGLLTVCVQYVIPLCIITFAYIRIIMVLRRNVFGDTRAVTQVLTLSQQTRAQRMQRARRNVVVTLLSVTLSFVVCWTPNQIVYTMFNLGFDLDFNGAFYHFTVIAVFANSCVNPFIYALKYDQFKAALFKSCKKEPNVCEIVNNRPTEGADNSVAGFKDEEMGVVAISAQGWDNRVFAEDGA